MAADVYDRVRGSIADVERRLVRAQEALGEAVESLDHEDPEGARYALDEAGARVEAAGEEAEATRRALAVARDRSDD